MINEFAPGYVGIFNLEDKAKIQTITPDFVEDTSGIYVRSETLSDISNFHSVHGLTPLQIRPSNLEDVFLKLTGKELSADA